MSNDIVADCAVVSHILEGYSIAYLWDKAIQMGCELPVAAMREDIIEAIVVEVEKGGQL